MLDLFFKYTEVVYFPLRKVVLILHFTFEFQRKLK